MTGGAYELNSHREVPIERELPREFSQMASVEGRLPNRFHDSTCSLACRAHKKSPEDTSPGLAPQFITRLALRLILLERPPASPSRRASPDP